MAACRAPASSPRCGDGERPALAQLERPAVPSGEPVEDGKVEVDHVPAGEHVGVQLAHAAERPARRSFSFEKGRACAGQLPPGGVRRSTSDAPQPWRLTASRRRAAGSVSMSRERTRSRGVQSAGTISGSSKTRPRAATSRPSPRISREPRMPGRSGDEWRSGRRPRRSGCRPWPDGRAAGGTSAGSATSMRHDGPPEESDLVGRDLPSRAPLSSRAPRRPSPRRTGGRAGGHARGTDVRPRAVRRGGGRAPPTRRGTSAAGMNPRNVGMGSLAEWQRTATPV